MLIIGERGGLYDGGDEEEMAMFKKRRKNQIKERKREQSNNANNLREGRYDGDEEEVEAKLNMLSHHGLSLNVR